ncbi:MAG: MFS transporter [Chloroflexia bacterium]|nr:MFS transporter [Chloroflexia bacterium]
MTDDQTDGANRAPLAPPRSPTHRRVTATRRARPQRRVPVRHTHRLGAARDRPPDPSADIEFHPVGGVIGAAESPDFASRRRVRFPRRGAQRRTQPTAADELSLLSEPGFRTFWLSRLISQTAQGALLYALLILVVDLSDRSFFTSLFVVCANIPSLLFGVPAGIVVDTVPRRFLLVLLNLFRFLFMLLLVATEPSLPGIFAATLGIWVIHQFYAPSESSVMAAIVRPARYTTAQALSNLALTLAQLLGLVIIAPLLLKTANPRLLFAVCGALFIVAMTLTALLPALDERRLATGIARHRRSLRQSLGDGWRFARADRIVFEAIADDVLVGIGMSALVVIMPVYLERVLGTSKENTVFVFAPAALGLVAGLRLAPRLSRLFGERYLATMALLGFACCVAALGFIEPAHAFLTGTLRLPLDRVFDVVGISPLIAMAMLISIPAGFASAVVNVAARAILLARTPATLRGQVIATQGFIGNLGALVPTLVAGLATDLFGAQPIAVLIALTIVGGALAVHSRARRLLPVPASLG